VSGDSFADSPSGYLRRREAAAPYHFKVGLTFRRPSFLVQTRGAGNGEFVTQPLTLWLIGDGKPGHENQSLGLAEALQRRVACDVHRISLVGAVGMIGRLRAAIRAGKSLPKPDMILAAGHSTHPALLWLSRVYQAKSIVLMRPSLPLSWFDGCLAPEHDFPDGNDAENLIITRGAINRVVKGVEGKTGKLILVGGPSKTHGWDGDAVLQMLERATDRGGWDLTDSRRTPPEFLDQVRRRLSGVVVYSHQDTAPDWLPSMLRNAKEVWVTEDSISMIYEALTSGAKVGLLPVPRLRADSRLLRGIDALIADGYLTPFRKWLENQSLADPPSVLGEADRCAEMVLAGFRAC
jgi:mitochondrial fission protein ELM1